MAILAILWTSASWSQSAQAQTGDWNGTWVADGTLFSIEVTVSEAEFRVNEVQSLGFVWSAQTGVVSGNQAMIEATYAGATARIYAELTGEGTAIAFAGSCLPEFMLVCALIKDRQATFLRQKN